MPNSLMDMFQFQPTDAGGEPSDLGRMLQSRSNSLIGLGLGLMRGPGMGQALEGYQTGSAQDAAQAYRQQQLAHTKRQEAFQRSQAAQHQANFERQFARSDPANAVTEAQRAYRDIYGVPGTPDYKGTPETQQEFFKQFYLPKTEGDWQITKLPHPTIPGDEITVERNKRTGQTRLPQYPGTAGTAAAPTDAFTAGINQPVYGSGGSSYSAPAAPPAAAPSGAIPSSPSQAAPAGYRWGEVNPQSGRRELVPIEGGPATKLSDTAAGHLALLQAAKPGLEEAKKYFLDPKPLLLREGGDQAGGSLYSAGKQAIGEYTGSFEIGRQRRNVRLGIEAALRAATGAAAPETEVQRYTDMYAPSIQDSYETRKQKIEALDRFITTYEGIATRGHGVPKQQAPAASSGGVRKYNPETGKIE
jgi:hypothetical protein